MNLVSPMFFLLIIMMENDYENLPSCKKSNFPIIFPEVSSTFNDKSLSQEAEMVGWLVIPCQLLQSHPGTHSLGVPVSTLHVMHFGHEQQSLIQIPGLEDKREYMVKLKQHKGRDLYLQLPVLCAVMVSAGPLFS